METSKEVIDELSKILDATPKNLNRKTMTPKEKARWLIERYDETLTYLESKQKAKQCAFIAVDELILNCSHLEMYYWKEVKQEIEKL